MSKSNGLLAGVIIFPIATILAGLAARFYYLKNNMKVCALLALLTLGFSIASIVTGVYYGKEQEVTPTPIPLPGPTPAPANTSGATPWTCLANWNFPVRRNAFNEPECYSTNGVDCFNYEPGVASTGSCDPNVVTTPNKPLTCGSGTFPLYAQDRKTWWCADIIAAVPPLANPAQKPKRAAVTPWFTYDGSGAWRLNANGDAECVNFDGIDCATGNQEIVRQINKGKPYKVLTCGDPATDPHFIVHGKSGYDVPYSACLYYRDAIKNVDPSLYM